MDFPIREAEVEVLNECPVCLNSRLQALSDVRVGGLQFFETVFCQSCGLVFRRVRPSLLWFSRSWHLRDESQQATGFSPINEKIEEDRYARYRNTARFFKEILPARKLIDVGTGTGTGLKAFQDEGFDVIGIEPDPSRARVGRERFALNIIECTVDDYDCDPNSFEIVTCIHSLEHFHSPRAIMKSITSLVGEGGYAYVEVPDLCSFITSWHDSLYLGHMNNFSENNLSLLGASVGLRPIVRAYPKSTPWGINHVGVLFQKDGRFRAPMDTYLDAETVATQGHHARSAYGTGLSGEHQGTMSFSVPEINDLSLTYKASRTTHQSVEYNYIQKSVEYSPEGNVYRIKDPTARELRIVQEMEAAEAARSRSRKEMGDKEFLEIRYERID